jgi:predicted RNase H-like HicB family nuclease
VTHYRFTAVLESDREEPWRYNVRVPALPGCLTYGESIDDAVANAHEAITGYVESLLANGDQISIETHPTITITIVVTPDAA